MSKITHLIALTQTEVEAVYGSLITTKQICVAGFIAHKESGNVQGMQESQEVLKEINQVIEKIESRMRLTLQEAAEADHKKMKNNMYDPRREV